MSNPAHRGNAHWDSNGLAAEDKAILPNARLWTPRERMVAISVMGEAVKLLRTMLPASQYAQRVARALEFHRMALYEPPPLDREVTENEKD